eukprot:182930_1
MIEILLTILLFIKNLQADRSDRIRYLENKFDEISGQYLTQQRQFLNEMDAMQRRMEDMIKTITNEHKNEINTLKQRIKESQQKTEKMKEKFENEIQSIKRKQLLQRIENKDKFLKSLIGTYNANHFNDKYLLLSKDYEKYSKMIATEEERLE